MVERTEDICRVQLKDVRLSYPALFKAKAFGKGKDGEPAFSAEFLIPKDTSLGKKLIDRIEDAIEEAKYKQWGDDPKKWPKISKDKPFWKDGDDPDYERPETRDHMIVSSRNKKRPRVLGIDKEDIREEDGIIYGGCYVDAIVRVWAQDNDFGRRINCSLEAVRFRRDGDPFGAAPVDPDEFEDIDDDDDRGSRRRSSRDDDDRGSRRGRDDDRDEGSSSSRRGSSRDDDDDRGSRRRGRDEDDADAGRSSRRGRDRDEESDDRGSRGRGRDRDDDRDDDRGSRRSRDRDDDERDDRSRSRSRDDDDGDRRGGRRSRDEDDEDRPSRNSRSGRRRDEDDDI